MDLITPTFILSLVMILISIGVQYGMYQSFKIKTEIELQKFEERMIQLEIKSQQTDLKLQQLLDEMRHLSSTAKDHWERIFKKLDSYDENIKTFYRDYQLIKKTDS